MHQGGSRLLWIVVRVNHGFFGIENMILSLEEISLNLHYHKETILNQSPNIQSVENKCPIFSATCYKYSQLNLWKLQGVRKSMALIPQLDVKLSSYSGSWKLGFSFPEIKKTTVNKGSHQKKK